MADSHLFYFDADQKWDLPDRNKLESPGQRIRVGSGSGMLECPFVAKKRHSGDVAGTSAYPPTGDIRWPMSVIVLI